MSPTNNHSQLGVIVNPPGFFPNFFSNISIYLAHLSRISILLSSEQNITELSSSLYFFTASSISSGTIVSNLLGSHTYCDKVSTAFLTLFS